VAHAPAVVPLGGRDDRRFACRTVLSAVAPPRRFDGRPGLKITPPP
jgi:hypothetical protein